MAFDWSKVDGYREDMSAEEKLALLDSVKPEEEETPPADNPLAEKPAAKTGYVSKARFDQVSSELAAAKKELRSRMSVDEQKELDRQAKANEMETELKELRHEKAVSSYKASYLAQGYDEQLAEEAANAMADGDNETVFAVMKKQAALTEKAMRAKILKDTPVPPASDTPKDEKPEDKMVAAMRKAMGLSPAK